MSRPMPARARLALAVAIVATHGCGHRALPPEAPPRDATARGAFLLAPARYLAVDTTWIERGEDGLDHVIAGGRRLELARFAIAKAAPASPEVDAGARSPAWTPARYVFWKNQKLYGASTFTGALTPIATLPAPPLSSFDWLNGAGIRFQGGAVVVPASGPIAPLGVPLTMHAVAADARRAVALTAFGRAVITSDGGATFREAADLRGGAALGVRGDDVVVTLPDGRERFLTASGAIVDARTGHTPGRARGRAPEEEDAASFPGGSAAHAIELAARSGLPTGDGGAVVTDGTLAGRLDLTTLRMTSAAALVGLDAADCVALRAPDAPLLVCADETHATVLDLSGAPRVERTFDLAGAPERVRFTGVDGEALGYLGPCDGPPEPAEELSVAGEPYVFPREHTSTFCVRAGRDAWVEHHLDPADATDVLAWIPRAGGAAAAIVARPGTSIPDPERVSVRGALRVVRVARSEPPMALQPYGWEAGATLDRSLRVGPDDTIEGWLPSSTSAGTVAMTIDADGRPRAWPLPPLAGPVASSGPLALTRSDDGKLWETLDGGRVWTEVEPPPSAEARPSSCSPVGCLISPFVRLGWTTPAARAPLPPPANEDAEVARPRRVPPPITRLVCSVEGAPDTRRVGETDGFGAVPASQNRRPLTRLGTLGVAVLPYSGPGTPVLGNVELGWVAPLDVTGALRRASLPASLVGAAGSQRIHEARLGWLLAEDGSLDAIALGRGDRCLERVLDAAGAVRAIGGCADEPTVAVEVAGRTFAVHAVHQSIVISAGHAGPRPRANAARAKPAPASQGAGSLQRLSQTAASSPLAGFTIGIGARNRAPVLVGVDLNGQAVLAPIDPVSGAVGVEERARPLGEAMIGSSPACAPRPDDARVVLPLEGQIALARGALRGVLPAAGAGVAVVRWSRDRACVDAVEIPVRDERYDDGPGGYERTGVVHKLIARLGPSGPRATLLSITQGMEVRQKVACTKLAAGE